MAQYCIVHFWLDKLLRVLSGLFEGSLHNYFGQMQTFSLEMISNAPYLCPFYEQNTNNSECFGKKDKTALIPF